MRFQRLRQIGELVDRQHQGPGETAMRRFLRIARVQQHESAALVVVPAAQPVAQHARFDGGCTPGVRLQGIVAERDDLALVLDPEPAEGNGIAFAVLHRQIGETPVFGQGIDERLYAGARSRQEQVDAFRRHQHAALQPEPLAQRPHARRHGFAVGEAHETVGGDVEDRSHGRNVHRAAGRRPAQAWPM